MSKLPETHTYKNPSSNLFVSRAVSSQAFGDRCLTKDTPPASDLFRQLADSLLAGGDSLPQAETQQPDEVIPVLSGIVDTLLKRKLVGLGRYWLLIHDYLNRRAGEQLIDRVELIDFLECTFGHSRRYISQLLKKGEGLFWERTNFGRIFVYGQSRVCINLDPKRNRSKVDVPVSQLTGKIKAARSILLIASIEATDRDSRPISQAAIEEIAGVPSRTQTRYVTDSPHIERIHNIEILAELTGKNDTETLREAAAIYGNAVFPFRDKHGKQRGKQQQWYAARNMPNSYTTSLKLTENKSAHKRINRKIRSLLCSSDRPMSRENAACEHIYFVEPREGKKPIALDENGSLRWDRSLSAGNHRFYYRMSSLTARAEG